MKLLALETAKKDMRVSMSYLYANNYAMTAGAGFSSATTHVAKHLGASNVLMQAVGGLSISCVGTSARKTLLDITGQVLLGYIILPYFEDTTADLAKSHVVYVTADGVEYKFELIKGTYRGRLLAFNAATNLKSSFVSLQNAWNLYMQGDGLHCKTSLKIEIEAVGYADYAHSGTSNKENECHIIHKLIEVDGSMADGTLSNPPAGDYGLYNKKIEDFINA